MAGLESLADAVDEVFREIRAKFKEASQHAGIIESLQAFIAAIDWKEPWLIGVLVLQALLFMSVIFFRNSSWFNLTVLILAATTVYNAKHLNTKLSEHWHSFARQPYFDQQGVFISAILSAPLLCTMFVQLVMHLWMASHMLVDMKRKELQHKARQRARAEREAAPAARESKKTS